MAMAEPSYIGALQHQEHREWLNQLDFFQDEIKIFQQELMQVLHRHPNYLSILEHVDEYRDILMKKLQHIDDFRRQIILQEKNLSRELEPATEGLWDHSSLRTEIREFIQEYLEFKETFRRFVAHND